MSHNLLVTNHPEIVHLNNKQVKVFITLTPGENNIKLELKNILNLTLKLKLFQQSRVKNDSIKNFKIF